ncbi:MAG: ATP synthase F1 subunit gamma [Chitinophagales bacterium]|nr:ATP synthase F1 subunit gamma [Chitinophagales bacterium]
MPGQLKEVRNRIKSVTSTQQITKAMKMVSAAKLRKATERITQIRPYSNKLNEMLSNIASGADVNIELAQQREIKNILVVVVTSDRGLAGAFNSNIIKLAKQTISSRYQVQEKSGKVTIATIGKKSHDLFKRSALPLKADYTDMLQHGFNRAADMAQWMMDAYINKEFDVIEIIYSQFKNAATQIFTVEPFLPVVKSSGKNASRINFIFEPEQETLVNELVPKILKTQFYKIILDTIASEHGARMTAMDKASENANELLKDLSIKYNRARQAAITTELTEIVGGAAALTDQ